MAHGSRILAEPRLEISGKNMAGELRKAVLTTLWSPLLLLTGIVHILCQPLTKKVLLGAVILDIPLQWGMHLEMTQGAPAAMGALNGFELSITTLSLAGLYIGWLFTGRVERRRLHLVWNWPIAAYTAAVAGSIFVASDLQLSLFQVFLMLEMLCFYLYCAANITSRDDIHDVLYLVLTGGIIESTYMLLLAAVGHELTFLRTLGLKTVIYLPVRAGDVMRFGGTIGSPNYAAGYLGMLIILAIAIRQMKVPSRLRKLTIPTIVLAVPALLITFSRGGLLEVMLAVSFFTMAYWFRKGFSVQRALTVGTILAVAVAFLFVPNAAYRRFTENDNGSAYSRVPLMHLAEHIIAGNPIFGVGANNFTTAMGDYEGPEFRHAWVYTVHNEFLLVWAETGIIGFAAYLWIYASLIRRGWRLWKRRDAAFAPLGLGIMAAICGLLLHMLVDVFSTRALIQLVWLLAAVIGACELIQRIEADEPAPVQACERKFVTAV